MIKKEKKNHEIGPESFLFSCKENEVVKTKCTVKGLVGWIWLNLSFISLV